MHLQAGFNVKPNEDTPLSELLQLSLEKHLDELSLISSQASKEYALEKVGQCEQNIERIIDSCKL